MSYGNKKGKWSRKLSFPWSVFLAQHCSSLSPPKKDLAATQQPVSLFLSVVVVVTSVGTKEFLLPRLGLGRENEEEEERPFALLCSVPLSPLHNLWPSSLGASVVSGNTAKIKSGESLFALVSTLVAHTRIHPPHCRMLHQTAMLLGWALMVGRHSRLITIWVSMNYSGGLHLLA